MSDMEPPPESDDPYEVLGVSWDDDEKTVRRAYVRLIRVWRPERHPKTFQRIQEAYEEARERFKHNGARAPRTSAPTGELDVPQEVRGRDAELLGDLWACLARGDDAQADLLFARFTHDAYDRRLITRHRYLIDEFRLGRREAAGPLIEALGRGENVLASAEQFLATDDVRDQRQLGDLTWERLAAFHDRGAALRLFALHVDQGLIEGAYERLADEVESPAYENDAEDSYELQFEVQRIAAVLAWRDPARASRLAERWPTNDRIESDSWTPQDHLERALALSEGYQGWLTSEERPTALVRYLEVSPVLSTHAVGPLCRRLPSKRNKPDPEWIRHMSELEQAAPGAADYVALAAGLERASARQLRPDATDRAILLGRHYHSKAMRGCSLSTLTTLKWIALLVLVYATATLIYPPPPWWVFAAGGTLLSIVGSRGIKAIGERRYKRHVRIMFSMMVLILDLHPGHLANWLAKEPPGTGELQIHESRLREDPVPRALWALQGVAELGREAHTR